MRSCWSADESNERGEHGLLFFKASVQVCGFCTRLVAQGCSIYACHGAFLILFNCCVDTVWFRKAYMKLRGAHNKEQHRPSWITAFWDVVRPAWALFRPLQCRREPYCYQAAVIAAQCCSIPRHEQHTEHTASWSKWGFTAAMQALVLGQNQGTHGREGQWFFPWVSMRHNSSEHPVF